MSGTGTWFAGMPILERLQKIFEVDIPEPESLQPMDGPVETPIGELLQGEKALLVLGDEYQRAMIAVRVRDYREKLEGKRTPESSKATEQELERLAATKRILRDLLEYSVCSRLGDFGTRLIGVRKGWIIVTAPETPPDEPPEELPEEQIDELMRRVCSGLWGRRPGR